MNRPLYRQPWVVVLHLLIALVLGFLLGAATVSRASLESQLLDDSRRHVNNNTTRIQSSKATALSSIEHIQANISLNGVNMAEF